MASSNSTTVKITTVGDSIGIVLPQDLLDQLQVRDGDSLQVTQTPHGVELTPVDTEFAEQLEVAKQVMQKRREVLKKLAE